MELKNQRLKENGHEKKDCFRPYTTALPNYRPYWSL